MRNCIVNNCDNQFSPFYLLLSTSFNINQLVNNKKLQLTNTLYIDFDSNWKVIIKVNC